jgi:Tol biopolymer transport system component
MGAPAGIPDEVVHRQLQKILVSSTFIHSERLRRFLRFCVEQTTQGKPENLREYIIALEVFDRPDSYNPATDPIVRVEARRLRSKLKHYYQNEGGEDPLIIDVPKGAYLPTFQLREPVAEAPQRIPWKIITGAVLAAVVVIAAMALRHPAQPVKLTLLRLTSDAGLTTDAAISTDGSLVAYASDRGGKGDLDIWLQQVAGGDAIRLTQDAADDHEPSFSADRTMIAFRSERDPAGIYAVPALGGEAKLIARDGRDPRYSPDGNWIAYWIGSPGGDVLPPAGRIYLVPAAGGAARQLCTDFVTAAFPVWSPDGRRLLFEGSRDAPTEANRNFDWWMLSIDSGKIDKTGGFDALARNHLRLAPQRRGAAWMGNGLVFAASTGDSTNLWQWEISGGTPQRLTLGSSLEVAPAIASNGWIAFSSLSETVDVWSSRMEVNRGEMASWMERVTEAAAKSTFPSLSADGSKVAYLSNKARGDRVWVKDRTTGQEAPVTLGNAAYPKISPGGTKVAFLEGTSILVAPAAGGTAARVCSGCGRVWDWSRDGKRILYVAPGSPNAAGELTLASGAKRILLKHDRYDLASTQLSPDDRWIAFHAIRGPTQRQVFIASYDAPGADWIPVTDGSGLDRNAVWSPDGNLLYFISERDGFRCIWAQRLDPASKRPSGAAFPITHFHSARRSLFPLGDVGAIGLSAAPDRLVFSLSEETGNIWLARPEAQP